MTYREVLEENFNVSLSWRDVDDKESYRIVGMNKGLWTEDEVKIVRRTYTPITDKDGSMYIMRDGVKVLLKAPTESEDYCIKEDVNEIYELAFKDCEKLMSLIVPYTINDFDLDRALANAPNKDRIVVDVHDWPYDYHNFDEMLQDIEEGYVDDMGFVYSMDKKRLLRAAPKVGEYWIPEGVEKIERLAFIGCRFETLHVPYTCKLDLPSDEEYPLFGSERVAGDVVQWNKPYNN